MRNLTDHNKNKITTTLKMNKPLALCQMIYNLEIIEWYKDHTFLNLNASSEL